MNKNIPKMLQTLKHKNQSYIIKVRFRQIKASSPYHLYLDFWGNNKRLTKSLKMSIVGNMQNKVRDDNTIRKAISIRQQYQDLYDANPDDFSFVTEANHKYFINFFKTIADKKTDKNYRLAYTKFISFCNIESLEIRKVNYALCEDFKDYLIKLNISKHTAKHYFTCFKGCLNYAVKRDLIDKNPANGILIRYQRKSVERLFKSEVLKLLNTPCDYHDLKNGFIFSCYTGLRFSDIINLEFDDIIDNNIKVMQQKTLNEVKIPLHSIARKILKEQRIKSCSNKLFHIPTGGKTSKEIQQWMISAGINKHITFHCSRHTFGCLLVENGVNLFVIKKLMGHRKIETTLQYIDKANVDAVSAIKSL